MPRLAYSFFQCTLRRFVSIILITGATVWLLILVGVKDNVSTVNLEQNLVSYELAELLKESNIRKESTRPGNGDEPPVLVKGSSSGGFKDSKILSEEELILTKPTLNIDNLSWKEFLSISDPKLPNNNGYRSPAASLLSICSPDIVRNLSKGLDNEDIAFCQWALKSGGVKVSNS